MNTPAKEWEGDLKPFEHGEEGTHFVCSQQHTQCCGCTGHDCQPLPIIHHTATDTLNELGEPQPAKGWEERFNKVFYEKYETVQEAAKAFSNLFLEELSLSRQNTFDEVLRVVEEKINKVNERITKHPPFSRFGQQAIFEKIALTDLLTTLKNLK